MLITARPSFVALCTLTALSLGACSGKSDSAAPPASSANAASSAASAPSPAPLPPVTVTTVQAHRRDFPVGLQGNGIVTPLNSVDLRSQVTSTVSKVHFSDGDFVKAGQLLFTLDARTDEANLAKARAQLAKSQASLTDSKRQFDRARQLFAQNFISQGALDTAQSQIESTAASAVADQAAVDAARVALSFSRIAAPSAGRAGTVHVSVGSLVQANTTPLVTVTQLDPIAVAFSIPQRNLPDALAALKGSGALVQAQLADGGGRFQGKLQFVDNNVATSSGTVQARAVFSNKEGKLWPGAYIDISQTVRTLVDATTIPQAAVVQSPRGTLVYVLDQGKARAQPVQVVHAAGGQAAVTGIAPGDMVVMDGKQNVRPGSPLVERAPAAKGSEAAATRKGGASSPAAAEGAQGAASGAAKP